MQATPSDTFLIRVHPDDYARFIVDRGPLETRWTSMLVEAIPSSRREELRPRAILHEDGGVVAGSVVVEAVFDERAQPLALIRGDGTRIALVAGLTIGRAAENDVVFDDALVSRRHAVVVAAGTDALAIEDLGSTNGTYIDGKRIARVTRLTAKMTIGFGETIVQVGYVEG